MAVLSLAILPRLAELLIPALNWRTARVLGLPIPPPLNIAIRPNRFQVRHHRWHSSSGTYLYVAPATWAAATAAASVTVPRRWFQEARTL